MAKNSCHSMLYDSNNPDAIVGLFCVALGAGEVSPPKITECLEKNHIPLVQPKEVGSTEA